MPNALKIGIEVITPITLSEQRWDGNEEER